MFDDFFWVIHQKFLQMPFQGLFFELDSDLGEDAWVPC